ncbi:hypothetical protein [Roseomonas sp. HF4]|uniref:hypothetical protein n=1 Tax=Roseomonas sp. HF4 TaxID=2562313 RepID=UPI0010BFAABB|nr:hypothetical protein [Roseomonas sp. HF4]
MTAGTAAKALGGAAVAALLAIGIDGTVFGVAVAGREVQGAPAALAGIALMVLAGDPRQLPAAAGWVMLGAAGAVALRAVLGTLGADGWMPGESMSGPAILAEAAWLLAFGILGWRGASPALLGPALGACVATRRIGGYGQALVPVMWEDTYRDAVLVGASVLAGGVAGLLVLLLVGWGVAILARLPAPRAAPGRVLAALAAAAAIGHMLRL